MDWSRRDKHLDGSLPSHISGISCLDTTDATAIEDGGHRRLWLPATVSLLASIKAKGVGSLLTNVVESVAVIAILRIIAYRNTLDDVTNISWQHTVLAIYTEIEMHYSLIAATIPCMQVFLRGFNTGYLGTTADQVEITATMAATKGSNSYVMSTVRSRHTQNSDNATGSQQKSGTYGGKDIKLRPNDGISTSRIAHKERSGDSNTDAGSIESDRSDKIMVRRTVDVDYGRQASRSDDIRWP